jgi:hypothetical protein
MHIAKVVAEDPKQVTFSLARAQVYSSTAQANAGCVLPGF